MRSVMAIFCFAVSFSALASKDVTPTVTTESAKKTEIFDRLAYPAKIDSTVNAKLLADSDGVVTKILAPLGARVPRRQGVVQLQNMEPGYSYAPMQVRSPVTGVVSQLKVTVGSHVARGQEIATIIDPTSLRVIIEVTSTDRAHLHPGTKGELSIEGIEKPLAVETLGISPLVDPATGTSTAELKLLDSKQLLSPGTLGQVRFKINSRKAYVIPDAAVVYKGEATNLRLVVAGKSKLVPVKLGPKKEGKFEVLSGVKDGDQIITRTSGYIADGDAVTVQAKNEDPAEKVVK